MVRPTANQKIRGLADFVSGIAYGLTCMAGLIRQIA